MATVSCISNECGIISIGFLPPGISSMMEVCTYTDNILKYPVHSIHDGEKNFVVNLLPQIWQGKYIIIDKVA